MKEGKKLKVVLLNLKPFVNVQGGVEKVFCSMGNWLVDNGYEVAFIGMDKRDGLPYFPVYPTVNMYNIGDVTVNKLLYKFLRLFYINKLERHKFDRDVVGRSVALKLNNILVNEAPDVIVSFHIKDTYILKKYMDIDCPIITMFHCHPEVYFKEVLFDAEVLRTTEKSECLQVLLPSFVDNISDYIKHNNVVTIGNVVYQNQDKNFTVYGNSKVIINVGRIGRKDKRQHLLIEAFNKLQQKYPEWNLEFWGDTESENEYYNQCCDLVKKYKLYKRVKFCGVTVNIDEQLARAQIFAFPSAYEGFSLALTEAMSMGLPSVGFKNAPSVNELIRDGSNGILCDDTIEDFARGLEELMKDTEKRKKYGVQAKEDMKQYAPEIIWNKWEKLINKTVADYNMNKDNY